MPPSPPPGRRRPRRRSRPPPTPAPPASLVKLLRKDPQVLQYFQSLQANLEADVQVWKDRAKAWERQVRELQNGAKKTRRNASRTKAAANASSSSSSSEDNNPESDNSHDKRHDPKSSKRHKANKAAPTQQAAKKQTKKAPSTSHHDCSDEESDNHHQQNDGKRKRRKQSGDATATSGKGKVASLRTSSTKDAALQSDDDDECNGSSNPREPNWYTAKQNNPAFALESENEEEDSKPKAAQPSIDDLSYPSDSDDDDDDEDKTAAAVKAKQTSALRLLSIESASDDDSDSETNGLPMFEQQPKKPRIDSQTQSYLDELVAALDELGIATVNAENNNKRRTNEEMWKDFRFALQTLCRVALTDSNLLETYPPFDNKGEAAPGEVHPARLGLRLIFRSLLLLESFGDLCDPEIQLHERQGLIDLMERTLRKEIQQGWAVTDRAARWHPTVGGPPFVPPQDQVDNDDNNENFQITVSAKSLPKLCTLLERSYWARILTGLYISRNNTPAAVRLVQEYVLATVPCHSQEDALHPRLAPVLSFVTLEALVKPCLKEMGWGENNGGHTDVKLYASLFRQQIAAGTGLSDVFAVCCQYTASIWKDRATSELDQIRHVAQLECAAYQRLCAEGSLPENTTTLSDANGLSELRQLLENHLDSKEAIAGYQLCLVLQGSLDAASLVWDPDKDLEWNCNRLESWCMAIRQVYVRRLEEASMAVGTKAALNCPADSLVNECGQQFGWLWDLNPFESKSDKARVLATLINCAASLADGDSVIRYTNLLLDLLGTMKPEQCEWQSMRPVWDVLRSVSRRPVARVINLQRRHDRWKHILCQAMAQQFLIVRGVGDFQESDGRGDVNFTYGGYAVDGEWPWHKVLDTVGSPSHLANLIQRDWRPLELAPFDKDAPRTEKTVSMHPSEVACALSHIACWKASNRTFNLLPSTTSSLSESGLLRQVDKLRRNVQLAGFASGSPLRQQNNGMYPTPVCLVLEDDATVVDDFVAGLQDLLAQLPRDFHYCALGYARPKSAPILSPWPSRPRVGVPTHLFFATAYVVSPSGLAYMEEHGPVEGPIDAWLGLRQTHNFDNLIGERLGVGSHGKGGDFTADQATTILDFQCYCALPPLCSQRLRNSSHPPGKARRWKDKDTDITYSGHM